MKQENKYKYTPLPEPIPVTKQLWPVGTLPLVHTRTMTFMHEKYIKQCIEGVLMQKTTFPVQVLIHDDASTDKTAEIIRAYEQKYPNLIKVYYQLENSHSKKDKRERRAEFFNWRIGKYEAICEGDDYWTDPYKLQKQVSLLETEKDLAGCAHGCTISYASGRTDRKFIYKKLSKIDFPSHLRNNFFLTHGSMVYKTAVLKNIPPFTYELFATDFLLKYSILSKGCIGYIPQDMSVYRKGSTGSWSNRKLTNKVVNKEFSDNLRTLFYYNEITESKYHKEIHQKTKKIIAMYMFRNVTFNSFLINLKNFFFAIPNLSFRVNVAFLKSIFK